MFEFNATLIVAVISFVVFMFIMNAIFYRPIFRIINKRNDYINSNYKDAQDFSMQAQQLNEKHESELLKVKEQSRKQVAQNLDIVQKEFFDSIKHAKEEAKKTVQIKKDELQNQKDDILGNINSNIVNDLSDIIVSKIIK